MLMPLLDRDEFARIWENGQECLFLVYSRDCGYCHEYRPIVRRYLASRPDLRARELDAERYEEESDKLRVKALPSLIYVARGKVVARIPGFHDAAKVRGWIEEHVK